MLTRLLRGSLIAAAFLLTIGSLSHLLRTLWWGFFLGEHLRIQLFFAALLLLIVAAILQRKLAWLLLIPLAINAYYLAPYVNRAFGANTGAATLSITHLSIDKDKVDALTYLDARADDVLFVQEVTPAVVPALEALTNYTLVDMQPLDNTHGSAMLIHNDWNGTVTHTEFVNLPADNPRPLLIADITVDQQPLTLMSLHVIRPGIDPWRNTYMHTELTAVADWAASQPDPLILIGDFNSTPWSTALAPLRDAGLTAGLNGQGLHNSWHASLPWVLRVPIDQSMQSAEIEVLSIENGPALGSDHLPLHASYKLQP